MLNYKTGMNDQELRGYVRQELRGLEQGCWTRFIHDGQAYLTFQKLRTAIEESTASGLTRLGCRLHVGLIKVVADFDVLGAQIGAAMD